MIIYYMNYNYNHIITYNTITDKELKDHAYRLDFLKCFNCESYNDSVNETITHIYNITSNNKNFIELYSSIRGTYNIVNDNEMCLVYLFSYSYLYLFHEILSKFIEKNEIDQEKIENLCQLIANS